jgi:hypothetical protein
MAYNKDYIDKVIKMANIFSEATKFDPFSIELPKTKDVNDRIEWAGERITDVVEGILTGENAWWIWSTIIGWADLANENDRRQYLALANALSDILKNHEEE